jgi:spore coat protein A, manganese oxidase
MAMPPQPMQAPIPASPKKPILHSLELTPFVDPLPLPQRAVPGPGGKLRIGMREVHVKVHRDVPATRMWVYNDLPAKPAEPTALAPIIEARSGHPLDIEWVNNLPQQHFLPIDHSLHGCGKDVPDVRAIVHVH